MRKLPTNRVGERSTTLPEKMHGIPVYTFMRSDTTAISRTQSTTTTSQDEIGLHSQ